MFGRNSVRIPTLTLVLSRFFASKSNNHCTNDDADCAKFSLIMMIKKATFTVYDNFADFH